MLHLVIWAGGRSVSLPQALPAEEVTLSIIIIIMLRNPHSAQIFCSPLRSRHCETHLVHRHCSPEHNNICCPFFVLFFCWLFLLFHNCLHNVSWHCPTSTSGNLTALWHPGPGHHLMLRLVSTKELMSNFRYLKQGGPSKIKPTEMNYVLNIQIWMLNKQIFDKNWKSFVEVKLNSDLENESGDKVWKVSPECKNFRPTFGEWKLSY